MDIQFIDVSPAGVFSYRSAPASLREQCADLPMRARKALHRLELSLNRPLQPEDISREKLARFKGTGTCTIDAIMNRLAEIQDRPLYATPYRQQQGLGACIVTGNRLSP